MVHGASVHETSPKDKAHCGKNTKMESFELGVQWWMVKVVTKEKTNLGEIKSRI